jgi:membrane-bound metal-dependent hydrolase YbcI (DUF457 family)
VFVGHALLAFALTATAARVLGWSQERALSVGLVAGVFAAIPDVDMAYALVGVAGVGVADALTLAGAFWAAGNVVHRAVTHSLVLAVPVALAVVLWVAGRRRMQSAAPRGRLLAGGALLLSGGVVLVAGAESGPLGAAVTVLFCGLAVLVAEQVVRRTALSPPTVGLAAAVGLLSHPFGDLFTGQPPAMLYPLDATLFAGRVTLSADPTLHLLSAFGLELATVWAALVIWGRLHGVSVRALASPWAGVGTGYALVIFLLPPPTLSVSYHFVFSVLAVGAVGLAPLLTRRGRLFERGVFADGGVGPDDAEARLGLGPAADPASGAGDRPGEDRTPAPTTRRAALPAVVTGLSAVTLAWVAYGLAYLVTL